MVWPQKESGANRQVGRTQLDLLRRAALAPNHQIIVMPSDNALWCAIKRLTQRGLFERQQFGSDVLGWTTVYRITDRGLAKYREFR